MDATYNTTIQEQILAELDGWRISDNAETITNESINPFVTVAEANESANKTVTSAEIEHFYEVALDKALLYTNRLNIDDLTDVEGRLYLRGVVKLTASDLWNKYNIMVNDSDMEATPSQSYGGVLYKQSMDILHQFINQHLTNIHTVQKASEVETANDWWIV